MTTTEAAPESLEGSSQEKLGQQMLDGFDSYKPKPIKRRLQVKEKNFISYCEQYYHKNRGDFPTAEMAAFALKYSLTEINYFLLNQNVIAAFYDRGIDVEMVMSKQSSIYLSPIQIACALTVSNFADARSIELKLEQLGVAPLVYYAWLKSPVYSEFVRELADQALDNIYPEAMSVFAQLIRSGDARALKMYFDMTGIGNNDRAQIDNLRMTVQRLVESVQRHVKDPSILQAVAADLHLAVPVAETIPIKVEVESGAAGVFGEIPAESPVPGDTTASLEEVSPKESSPVSRFSSTTPESTPGNPSKTQSELRQGSKGDVKDLGNTGNPPEKGNPLLIDVKPNENLGLVFRHNSGNGLETEK